MSMSSMYRVVPALMAARQRHSIHLSDCIQQLKRPLTWHRTPPTTAPHYLKSYGKSLGLRERGSFPIQPNSAKQSRSTMRRALYAA